VSAVAGQHQYACPSCGAALEVVPGTAGLACPYCRTRLGIATPEGAAAKHDYTSYAALAHPPVAALPAFTPTCAGCGSTTELTAIAGRCPSCRAPLVVSDDLGGRLKRPDGIVPFVVDHDRAVAGFRTWVSTRWFAPSALKRVANPESMRGTYLPHWGFDDRTSTTYTGQRGDHYYTTEPYTTQEDGRTVTNTREVRHTRWSRASGQVRRDFVDVLAAGVHAPAAELLGKLGPWSTSAATAYQPELLAGFDAPRYDVDPCRGFAAARQDMAGVIEHDCRDDIGGDEQRVSAMETQDEDVLFRLLLMPLWVATYVAAGTVFHVYVNANTGKVIGERPYSRAKIALVVAAALAAVLTTYLAYRAR
jgi:hypothetical protein